MARYFEPITTEELKQKINSAITKYSNSDNGWDFCIEDYYDSVVPGANRDQRIIEQYFRGYEDLTKAIKNDVKKVEFSSENVITNTKYNNAPDEVQLLGYHMLDNGMPFFGLMCGGDWEYPVFWIIYWSGKEIRGYIPADGNIFNTETKKAFGNSDSDGLNLENCHSDLWATLDEETQKKCN